MNNCQKLIQTKVQTRCKTVCRHSFQQVRQSIRSFDAFFVFDLFHLSIHISIKFLEHYYSIAPKMSVEQRKQAILSGYRTICYKFMDILTRTSNNPGLKEKNKQLSTTTQLKHKLILFSVYFVLSFLFVVNNFLFKIYANNKSIYAVIIYFILNEQLFIAKLQQNNMILMILSNTSVIFNHRIGKLSP